MSRVECVRERMKEASGWIFLIFVILTFLGLGIMNVITPVLFASQPDNSTSGWIADSRCICVCPHNLNVTQFYNTTVFMKRVDDPAECTCELTIPGEKDEEICLRCSCGYESRNAALIALIVYGMLLVIFLLMPIYTLYVCVVPFVRRRRSLRTAASTSARGYSPINESSTAFRLESSPREVRSTGPLRDQRRNNQSQTITT